jgi:cell division protein FtsB
VADPLVARNHALEAENAQLREDLAAYKHNYAKLRAWAEEAARDLKQLRGEQT